MDATISYFYQFGVDFVDPIEFRHRHHRVRLNGIESFRLASAVLRSATYGRHVFYFIVTVRILSIGIENTTIDIFVFFYVIIVFPTITMLTMLGIKRMIQLMVLVLSLLLSFTSCYY